MLIWTTLKIAMASLTSNKLRSILTMLGVIIGVGAVIAMLCLGSAFGMMIQKQISMMGTNVLFVRSYHRGPGGGRYNPLKPEDAKAILDIKGVKRVSPMTFSSGTLKAGNKSNSTATIMGAAPSLPVIQNIVIEKGMMFDDHHVQGQRRVAVLGPKTAKDLFGDADPVGQRLFIHKQSYLVIGVTKAQGDQMGFSPDDRVLLPFTTAMKQLPPRRNVIDSITVEADSRESLDQVSRDITQMLRRRHHLQADEQDDFMIQNMAEILAAFGLVTLYLTLFLGTIAAISLVVGGIGIMNIMLATVAERTREIGIRKAIGAKDRDILRQFMIEALVVTLGGGLVGLALGWGLMALTAMLLSQWMELSPILQWWVVALAIGVSMTVGLVSGIYPAFRASRLDPVVALRYE